MFLKNLIFALLLIVCVNAKAVTYPDTISCYDDNPNKPGYMNGQSFELRFPQIPVKISGITNLVTGEVRLQEGADEVGKYKNIPIEVTLIPLQIENAAPEAVEIAEVKATLPDGNSILIRNTSEVGKHSMETKFPIKGFNLPVSARGTCLYLDGSVTKGGASVHN